MLEFIYKIVDGFSRYDAIVKLFLENAESAMLIVLISGAVGWWLCEILGQRSRPFKRWAVLGTIVVMFLLIKLLIFLPNVSMSYANSSEYITLGAFRPDYEGTTKIAVVVKSNYYIQKGSVLLVDIYPITLTVNPGPLISANGNVPLVIAADTGPRAFDPTPIEVGGTRFVPFLISKDNKNLRVLCDPNIAECRRLQSLTFGSYIMQLDVRSNGKFQKTFWAFFAWSGNPSTFFMKLADSKDQLYP